SLPTLATRALAVAGLCYHPDTSVAAPATTPCPERTGHYPGTWELYRGYSMPRRHRSPENDAAGESSSPTVPRCPMQSRGTDHSGEPDRAPDHGQGKAQVRPVPDRSRTVRSGRPSSTSSPPALCG